MMKVIAFAGGVGGAKLVDGLAKILPSQNLTIVVNTGDDFTHFGLHISPDVDTVCYTLAGKANPETGWGQTQDTWNAFNSICELEGPDWFHLGDKDLGVHLERTRRLMDGDSLTEITHYFCQKWGVHHSVFPMCDEPVATMVNTIEKGWLPFQEYFVKEKCEPIINGFRFEGIENSSIQTDLLEELETSELIVICPSNPWVSIDPILLIPGMKDAIKNKKVVCVSPIINGASLKGPAAKMFRELKINPSAMAVAEHYQDILSMIFLDDADAGLTGRIAQCGIIPITTNIFMKTSEDRYRLAKFILDTCEQRWLGAQ
jgi:LPPG:FO 2-phospho-L-lactate transferase